jgi:hypothetical protein
MGAPSAKPWLLLTGKVRIVEAKDKRLIGREGVLIGYQDRPNAKDIWWTDKCMVRLVNGAPVSCSAVAELSV